MNYLTTILNQARSAGDQLAVQPRPRSHFEQPGGEGISVVDGHGDVPEPRATSFVDSPNAPAATNPEGQPGVPGPEPSLGSSQRAHDTQTPSLPASPVLPTPPQVQVPEFDRSEKKGEGFLEIPSTPSIEHFTPQAREEGPAVRQDLEVSGELAMPVKPAFPSMPSPIELASATPPESPASNHPTGEFQEEPVGDGHPALRPDQGEQGHESASTVPTKRREHAQRQRSALAQFLEPGKRVDPLGAPTPDVPAAVVPSAPQQPRRAPEPPPQGPVIEVSIGRVIVNGDGKPDKGRGSRRTLKSREPNLNLDAYLTQRQEDRR